MKHAHLIRNSEFYTSIVIEPSPLRNIEDGISFLVWFDDKNKYVVIFHGWKSLFIYLNTDFNNDEDEYS